MCDEDASKKPCPSNPTKSEISGSIPKLKRSDSPRLGRFTRSLLAMAQTDPGLDNDLIHNIINGRTFLGFNNKPVGQETPKPVHRKSKCNTQEDSEANRNNNVKSLSEKHLAVNVKDSSPKELEIPQPASTENKHASRMHTYLSKSSHCNQGSSTGTLAEHSAHPIGNKPSNNFKTKEADTFPNTKLKPLLASNQDKLTDSVDVLTCVKKVENYSKTDRDNTEEKENVLSVAAVIPTPGNRPPSTKIYHQGKSRNRTCRKPSWKYSGEDVNGKSYIIMGHLGKGGNGEVCLVQEKDTHQFYALKRVNLEQASEMNIKQCLNEVELLCELKNSDFVVGIHSWDYNKQEKVMKILMERGDCDLLTIIRSTTFTPRILKFYWENILRVVEFLHAKEIVHADIKPANFILTRGKLKIIDFGIASRLQHDHTSVAVLEPKGTINFMSPESVNPDARGSTKVGPKSDIWSVGIILYAMVYGHTPFENISQLWSKVIAISKANIQYPPVPSLLAPCQEELFKVFKLCFQLDYKKRPSASELLSYLP